MDHGAYIEYAGARIVAPHHPFQNHREGIRQKPKLSESRPFRGLEGYRALVTSRLDAVVIEPPLRLPVPPPRRTLPLRV